jgi:putative endonuclease
MNLTADSRKSGWNQRECNGTRQNNRKLGSEYETLAAEYLRTQHYEILERNFRCRQGEIDIIARDGEYLCFVEVKYRANGEAGRAADAVNYRKQQKIVRVAEYYLMKHGLNEWTPSRFDVVAIDGTDITLFRNAYQA